MNPTNHRSKKRVIQTFRCLPLNSRFYEDIQVIGLGANAVYQKPYSYLVNGMKWFKSEAQLESTFIWLIKIGALRREVDGQGLTSKIRLTPLGREVLLENPETTSHRPGILEQIQFWLKKNWPR